MVPNIFTNKPVIYDYKNLEKLSKEEILSLLSFLVEKIHFTFIMMGGLLYTIRKNKWFEPDYQNFQTFCDSYVEIQYRKAMYLISIYEALKDNHIPFDKVAKLGYTKLVLITPHFSNDNYQTVIDWAEKLTVAQIEDELKGMAKDAKDFITKVSTGSTLTDVGSNVKETKAKPNLEVSNLKKIIMANPIQDIINALSLIYPDKEFSMEGRVADGCC